jgi:hypothetical protein
MKSANYNTDNVDKYDVASKNKISNDKTSNNTLDKTIFNIAKLVDAIDDRSKLVSEITGVVKGVISKDPKAIDDNFAAYFLQNTFGESNYNSIRKIYLDIIEVKRS